MSTMSAGGDFRADWLLPNTNWLEGAIERNRMGEIIIDAKCETNVKGVFAAGDCTPYRTNRLLSLREGQSFAEFV
jgi:alkyl hydroperoxide reductase subunit F